MEFLTKHHIVENCFRQYTSLVDKATSLVIAIIQLNFEIF